MIIMMWMDIRSCSWAGWKTDRSGISRLLKTPLHNLSLIYSYLTFLVPTYPLGWDKYLLELLFFLLNLLRSSHLLGSHLGSLLLFRLLFPSKFFDFVFPCLRLNIGLLAVVYDHGGGSRIIPTIMSAFLIQEVLQAIRYCTFKTSIQRWSLGFSSSSLWKISQLLCWGF